MKRVSTIVVLALMLGVILTACGGGPASSDPVETVKTVMQTVVDKKLDKLPDYACAAKKDDIKKQFDLTQALGGSGIDAQKVFDVMTLSLENPTYEKVSESGDTAAVQMKGKLIIKVDKAKFQTLMSDILKAQGQDMPADQLGPLVDAAATQLEQGQDISNTFQLTKENGKWVICQ